MPKDNTQILGISFPNNKTFYYFENGQHTPGANSVDRLRSVLMARGLITFTDAGSTKYEIITLSKAQADGLDTHVVYINNHIKKLKTSEIDTHKNTGSLWD